MLTTEIWTFEKPQELSGFLHSPCSAALWRRNAPPGSAELFDALPASFVEEHRLLSAREVEPWLGGLIPEHPLARLWLDDVAQLCSAFCQELGQERCLLSLDRERPCQRFHADNLSMRLVCTYRGPGTLWLSEDNLNRIAAETRGTGNQDIVKRPQDIHQLAEWEALVMKGKLAPSGRPLIHRSPPPQPGDPRSLILKLDAPRHG